MKWIALITALAAPLGPAARPVANPETVPFSRTGFARVPDGAAKVIPVPVPLPQSVCPLRSIVTLLALNGAGSAGAAVYPPS